MKTLIEKIDDAFVLELKARGTCYQEITDCKYIENENCPRTCSYAKTKIEDST